MAIKYGFFDSVGGDRKYNADDISSYFLSLISNGVFATPATCMQVVASSGMTVNVSPGWGFVRCKYIHNTTYESLTLEPANALLNRIDRIVIRLDPASRDITITVKKGEGAASAPVPPELTRISDGIFELSLAQITVNAGATAITQADITDERADTSVCGYVTGLIDQIDTTNLFAQFTAAFNDWFGNVQDSVKATTVMYELMHHYETATDDESEIEIGIPSFNYALDTLNVFVNGLKLVAGIDYTLNSDHDGIILAKALDVIGTPIDFQVLKSDDITEAESIVGDFQQLAMQVQALQNRFGGMTLMKCSQAQYDQMESHDANTLYIISDAE